jgi:perosamine synthetase
MFWNHAIGQKYRMSSMQAALGLAQLERLPELIERKRTIFEWYRRALGNMPGVTLNGEAPDVFNVYWMVTALVDPKLGWTKEKLIPALREHNIDCRPFFYPLSMQPAYKSFPTATAARQRNSASYAVAPYGVNLPSALSLTEEQVGFVAAELKAILQGV